jgi:flagellar biogenesis protein FliO
MKTKPNINIFNFISRLWKQPKFFFFLAFIIWQIFLIVPSAAQNKPEKNINAAQTKTVVPSLNTDGSELSEEESLRRMLAETDGETKPVTSAEPSLFSLFIKTLGALIIVIGLLFLGGWGFRKYNKTRFSNNLENVPNLAVINSVQLGNNRLLSVVKFGENNLLIGSTAQSINLLAIEPQNEENLITQIPRPRSVAALLAAEDSGDFSFAEELINAEERISQFQ